MRPSLGAESDVTRDRVQETGQNAGIRSIGDVTQVSGGRPCVTDSEKTLAETYRIKNPTNGPNFPASSVPLFTEERLLSVV